MTLETFELHEISNFFLLKFSFWAERERFFHEIGILKSLELKSFVVDSIHVLMILHPNHQDLRFKNRRFNPALSITLFVYFLMIKFKEFSTVFI